MSAVTARRNPIAALIGTTLALIAAGSLVLACSPPRESAPTPRATIAAATSRGPVTQRS